MAQYRTIKALKEIIKIYNQYVPVDGGLRHCIQLGIAPVWLCGAMDSVSPEDKIHFPKLDESC